MGMSAAKIQVVVREFHSACNNKLSALLASRQGGE